MLSMYSQITEMEIADLAVLRSGTVYLLTGHGGEKLVVKVEANVFQKQTLTHHRAAMKAVDKIGGNTKSLKDSEKKALGDYVAFMERITSGFAEDKICVFDAGPAAKDLKEALHDFQGGVWYKMPCADLTGADKLLEARMGVGGNAPDKGVMIQLADGLNADGGLEQLGRIIAADMYIGNTDRFMPTGGCKKDFGGKSLKFKTLVNPGNLFVVGKNTQQRISVSGHDFIDPNSGFKNYSMSLADVKEGYNTEWPGYYMCSASKRKKFASDVVDDLETILTPNRKAFSPFRKLDRNAAKRIERGMVDGMRLILKSLDSGYTKQALPVGVTQRRDAFAKALA